MTVTTVATAEVDAAAKAAVAASWVAVTKEAGLTGVVTKAAASAAAMVAAVALVAAAVVAAARVARATERAAAEADAVAWAAWAEPAAVAREEGVAPVPDAGGVRVSRCR